MADELPTITLKAIGIVRNEVMQLPRPIQGFREIVSDIVIDSSLTEALDGLEEFSHIIVIFYFHKRVVDGELPIKSHPVGKQEIPLVGLLAWRSANRPNPIGKTTVRLLQRQGNILRVVGLDAIDGTPVIDIKPYIPGYDAVTDLKVPQWLTDSLVYPTG